MEMSCKVSETSEDTHIFPRTAMKQPLDDEMDERIESLFWVRVNLMFGNLLIPHAHDDGGACDSSDSEGKLNMRTSR